MITDPSTQHVPYTARGAAPFASAPPRDAQYKWVYVWQWPIRAMHWFAAFAIVVLAITGFYIGRPYFTLPTDEGQQSPFIMGYMRLAHFIAAGVLVATAVVRIYWLFAGNKFERLPALFPVRPRDFRNLIRMVKFYLFIGKDATHPPHYLGHHPMQQLSYTLVYLVAALMVVTGFALYGGANPGGTIYTMFNWVNTTLGGAQITRVIHHVATWFFLIFIPLHIYLATRADVVEKEGSVSSIISGGRFVRADET
ncbi:MAG TPA: Ni/Fe-hydrogenase, b-type cytochrome subunit, partial [Gemmatimonadaceae bacterium]|nr:Ni/Fe-hydrogenase, b-type cytochrome subunit [Gemmatimonadaceae bacterium]